MLVNLPFRRVAFPRTMGLRQDLPFRLQSVFALQTPTAMPNQARGQGRVVVDRHTALAVPAVRLVVVREARPAGAVSQVVNSPAESPVLDLPVARIERLPVVSVIEGVRSFEQCLARWQSWNGDGRNSGRRRSLQESPAIEWIAHRGGIVPAGARRVSMPGHLLAGLVRAIGIVDVELVDGSMSKLDGLVEVRESR